MLGRNGAEADCCLNVDSGTEDFPNGHGFPGYGGANETTLPPSPSIPPLQAESHVDDSMFGCITTSAQETGQHRSAMTEVVASDWMDYAIEDISIDFAPSPSSSFYSDNHGEREIPLLGPTLQRPAQALTIGTNTEHGGVDTPEIEYTSMDEAAPPSYDHLYPVM